MINVDVFPNDVVSGIIGEKKLMELRIPVCKCVLGHRGMCNVVKTRFRGHCVVEEEEAVESIARYLGRPWKE